MKIQEKSMTAKTVLGVFAANTRTSRTIPAHFQRKTSAKSSPGAVQSACASDDLRASDTALSSMRDRTALLSGRDMFLTEDALLPAPEKMAAATSSSVATKWSQVREAVMRNGIMSITNHQRPQLILMNVEHYDSLRDRAARNKAAQPRLDELNAIFEAQFDSFQTDEFKSATKRMLEADGEFAEPRYLGPTR